MQSYIKPGNTFPSAGFLQVFSHTLRSRGVFNRSLHSPYDDSRQRLSAFWAPTGGIAHEADTQDSHAMLIRGGFVRQSHSGIFHLLPLGLRVQEKIERLLDKHMVKIGASKISLSTFSSEDLWERSGRLKRGSSELFRVKDRKDTKFLLSPTHEEEVTTLVGDVVQSYKELPLRLYQITRKYRDEPRPRQGLLRTREFLMKDLYTFDSTQEKALETYETVQRAYSAFFNEFKIPYLIAEADSGDIGGSLSHEYHIATKKGEDKVVSCTLCSYAANEEMARSARRSLARFSSSKSVDSFGSTFSALGDSHQTKDPSLNTSILGNLPYKRWFGVSKDRTTVFIAIYPAEIEDLTLPSKPLRKTEPNPYMIKMIFPDLDLSIEHQAVLHALSKPNYRICFDYRIPQSFIDAYQAEEAAISLESASSQSDGNNGNAIAPTSDRQDCNLQDLVKIAPGDACPNCADGTLRILHAVELGHTFHLGTRYSAPLSATFAFPSPPPPSQQHLSPTQQQPLSKSEFLYPPPAAPTVTSAPFQMGCHGIGVSRLLAAIAASLASPAGLNWPRAIAPFEVVIVPARGLEAAATEIYDTLTAKPTEDNREAGNGAQGGAVKKVDVVLDDREKDVGWKLKDADLIGYPVIVVVGRRWRRGDRMVEVQCRRVWGVEGGRELAVEDLAGVVGGLLGEL